MAQKDVGNKVPIYKIKKTDEVMKYYDEWGKGNKYDKDMVDWNYTGPKETAEVFTKYCQDKDEILCYFLAILGHSGGIPTTPEFMKYTPIPCD